jgi:hypothetical protein
MKNSLLALIGLGIIGSCALYAAPAQPTPVEVWTGGAISRFDRWSLSGVAKFQQPTT